MSDEATAYIRFAFFIVVACGYLIGSWVAEDEEKARHRDIVFWVLLIGASIMGTLADILGALPK